MVKNLVTLIDDFKNQKILVAGDIILDEFIWGVCKRINPEEEGAPLVNVRRRNYMLGGAGNVANNIASLGGKCDLWGCFGDDDDGKKIKKLCENSSIDLKNFYDKNPTIVKTRVIGGRKQIVRFDEGEENLTKINKETEDRILEEFEKSIENYDFVILSDYNKTFLPLDFLVK